MLIRPRFGAADESQLSIRGSGLRNNFHLRGVNVLLDGFVYGQADGFSDFESLELLTVKRIEIYKGASALRYGGFTLGGAVNLVTKTGDDEGLVGLRTEAGSFGYAKNHIATGQVYGPFDLHLSFTDVDLQLSRSVDGGKTFEAPLRVTDDTPTSHSFEGLAVAPDGTVLIAWIETRAGERPQTYLARVADGGRRVERTLKLDTEETCVCCRVGVAVAKPELVTVIWRKVFPGDVRDMVLARSRDGGRTADAPVRIHADNWRISACPHRGGSVAIDGRGHLHALWYTEGTRNQPDVLYAVAADGQRFGPTRRVHVSTTSIPDHARLGVNAAGHGVIVWEDSTAVRRRVVLRETTATGLGPTRVLSQAVKAYAPDVTVAPDGGAVVAWHEEQFPKTKTVILRVGAGATPGRSR